MDNNKKIINLRFEPSRISRPLLSHHVFICPPGVKRCLAACCRLTARRVVITLHGVCVSAGGPDLGPAAALCMFMCCSDSHHCSRSASASPLNASSHHHPHQSAERWRVSSASTPDITQRQRRRNSTPVRTHDDSHTYKHTVNIWF